MDDYLRYGFSIAGVQKAGTSTLSQTLDRHPQVCRAPRKELQFFTNEDLDWSDPPYAEYRAPRRRSGQVLAGDATPAYLWWPNALERMRAYDPAMLMIAIFRDPVERAFSHWLMLRTRSPHAPDWPDLIHNLRPTSLPTRVPPDVPAMRFKHQSAVARGYYAEQLSRGFEIFPREQWLLLEFRSMLTDFPGTLDRVTDFLGLHRFAVHPPLRRTLASPTSVPGTPPTAGELQDLAELYAADLGRFATMTGFDISHWPTRRILDGSLEASELAATFRTKVAPVA